MLAARILIALLPALVAIPSPSDARGAAESATLRLVGHADPEISATADLAAGGLVGVGARLPTVVELTASGVVASLPKTRVWGFKLGSAPCNRGSPELTPSSHWDYRLRYDGNAVDSPLVPRGRAAVDDLLSSASQADRGGLTRAGRSLTKHGKGARGGNRLFPPARGNPEQINRQAQTIVEEILGNSETKVLRSTRGRFGETIEYIAPDGRGIVYDAQRNFLFFRE